MRTLSLGDLGFDLVLGGGIAWVERVAGASSATVLVRGPAGAGKTLVALHIAKALATELEGNVAYGCVELLPAEFAAQALGLFSNNDSIVIDPRHAPAANDRRPHVVPVVLDVTSREASLSDALDKFWNSDRWLSRLGGRPRVVVIDSLIEGYGLGANVPREVADALVKWAAEQQVALVLIEEAHEASASPWMFAVDTVIELQSARSDVGTGMIPPTERRMIVSKHRFAPSDAGPHRFAFVRDKGVEVYPRPSAWLESWARPLIEARVPILQRSQTRPVISARLPDARGGTPSLGEGNVVLVHGPNAEQVRAVATSVSSNVRALAIEATFAAPLKTKILTFNRVRFGLADPYASPHRLLSAVLEELRGQKVSEQHVGVVCLGDLQALESYGSREQVLDALIALSILLRASDVVLVFFETTPVRHALVNEGVPQHALREVPGARTPKLAPFCDCVVELIDLATAHPQQPTHILRRPSS